MAAKEELRIILKTIGDLTGINAVMRRLTGASATVRVISKMFVGLGKAGGAALRLLGGAVRGLQTTMLGLTVAIAGSVREFVKFNGGMARAWTMAGWTVKQFVKVRREIIGLAGDLGVAKSQLTDGLYAALSKGVPENNVVSFLATAAKVAVTDGSTVVGAVEGITTVLNAFGIDAARTDEVVDKMFMTVASGGASFAQLAANISQVAPLAASAGVAFEDINAAAATMTAGGINASTTMTMLRAVIMGLNKVLGDGWSKTMSLQEAMVKVAEQAGGSQTALFKLTGTSEAMMGILANTGINADRAAASIRAQANAVGELSEANKKVDTQVQHWPKLKESLLGVVTQFGQAFDNVLKGPVTDIAKAINDWSTSTTFFATMEKHLETSREYALDIATALFSGQGDSLLSGLRHMLVGGIRMGFEKAVAFLLEKAPAIGDLIGSTAKRAIAGGLRGEAISSLQQKGKISTVDAIAMRAPGMGKAMEAGAEARPQSEMARYVRMVEKEKAKLLRKEGAEAARSAKGTGLEQFEGGVKEWKEGGASGAETRDELKPIKTKIAAFEDLKKELKKSIADAEKAAAGIIAARDAAQASGEAGKAAKAEAALAESVKTAAAVKKAEAALAAHEAIGTRVDRPAKKGQAGPPVAGRKWYASEEGQAERARLQGEVESAKKGTQSAVEKAESALAAHEAIGTRVDREGKQGQIGGERGPVPGRKWYASEEGQAERSRLQGEVDAAKGAQSSAGTDAAATPEAASATPEAAEASLAKLREYVESQESELGAVEERVGELKGEQAAVLEKTKDSAESVATDGQAVDAAVDGITQQQDAAATETEGKLSTTAQAISSEADTTGSTLDQMAQKQATAMAGMQSTAQQSAQEVDNSTQAVINLLSNITANQFALRNAVNNLQSQVSAMRV